MIYGLAHIAPKDKNVGKNRRIAFVKGPNGEQIELCVVG